MRLGGRLRKRKLNLRSPVRWKLGTSIANRQDGLNFGASDDDEMLQFGKCGNVGHH